MAVDQEIARLNFEVERGLKLYKTTTLLQDNSILNYDGDPNLAVKAASKGQALLHTSPLGTMFIQQNGDLWTKVESGFGALWEILGSNANTFVPPVVQEAISTSAGASEFVLAEEDTARTLHTDPELLILTDPNSDTALTWHDWDNETGQGDWVRAKEEDTGTLHLQNRSLLTDNDGIPLDFVSPKKEALYTTFNGEANNIDNHTLCVREVTLLNYGLRYYVPNIIVNQSSTIKIDIILEDNVLVTETFENSTNVSAKYHSPLILNTENSSGAYKGGTWKVKVTVTSVSTGETRTYLAGNKFIVEYNPLFGEAYNYSDYKDLTIDNGSYSRSYGYENTRLISFGYNHYHTEYTMKENKFTIVDTTDNTVISRDHTREQLHIYIPPIVGADPNKYNISKFSLRVAAPSLSPDYIAPGTYRNVFTVKIVSALTGVPITAVSIPTGPSEYLKYIKVIGTRRHNSNIWELVLSIYD